jgi:hypothetical protein
MKYSQTENKFKWTIKKYKHCKRSIIENKMN